MSGSKTDSRRAFDVGFYILASKLYKRLLSQQGSLASLCLDESIRQKKKMVALLSQALGNEGLLKEILSNSNIKLSASAKKDSVSQTLACLLIQDFLWGIPAEKEALVSSFPFLKHNKTRISAEWIKLKVKRNLSDNPGAGLRNETDNQTSVKYLRVNTLKTNLESVIEFFQGQGFSLPNASDEAPEKWIRIDPLVPNLLQFPSSAFEFHSSALYKHGLAFVQDKASCLPALALDPPPGSVVLDACSAPGNKTTQLSMLLNNTGRIFSIEKDKARFAILQASIQKAGSKNVTALNKDFLSICPTEAPFDSVQYILLDPSCSGSGMLSRGSSEPDPERLQKLSYFQSKMLVHALSFPNVFKVVYSTCSIYEQENEAVVQKSLKKVGSRFKLSQNLLPQWKTRGKPGILNPDSTQAVIRADPQKDLCNGFFVAQFERL